MLAAQCLQHLEKWSEAAGLYEKFIQDHPRHALAVEARFRLGECRLAEGDRKQARRVWQDLIAGQVGNLSHKHGGASRITSRMHSFNSLALGTFPSPRATKN